MAGNGPRCEQIGRSGEASMLSGPCLGEGGGSPKGEQEGGLHQCTEVILYFVVAVGCNTPYFHSHFHSRRRPE